MAPGPSSGVASLVASCRQHKKFRQLAGYSVQCLCRAITPPALNWQKSLAEACEAGALEAIAEVLKLHAGDDEITASATGCMAAIASDPAHAKTLLESGALMGLLESVVKNPTQRRNVRDTIALFEKVAVSAPGPLLEAGGADAATRLIQVAPAASSSDIVPGCVRTLERLVKEPAGPAALIECDAIKTITSILPDVPISDAEVLESSFRLLERLMRSPEHVEYVRTACDGLQVLSTVLGRLPPASKVAKTGGRVLAKLASSSVGELVARMKVAPAEEKEFLASLLANLALDEENSERIVASGGLGALSTLLGDSSSPRSILEASSRALAQLVTNVAQAKELVNSGAVAQLVSALDSSCRGNAAAAEAAEGAALATATTLTLSRLASHSPELLTSVSAGGGIAAVLRALAAHASNETLVGAALSFLEDALTSGDFDPQALVSLGAITPVVTALSSHAGKVLIQLDATRILACLSHSTHTVSEMVTQGTPTAVLLNLSIPEGVGGGGVSDSLGSAGAPPNPFADARLDLVAASMTLLMQCALLPQGKAAVGDAGAEVIMTAVSHYSRIAAVHRSGDGPSTRLSSIVSISEELMPSVVSQAQVGASLSDLAALTNAVATSKNKAEATKLRQLAMRVSAFAATPEFATFMLQSGGLRALMHSTELIATSSGFPDGERVLAAFSGALQGVLENAAAQNLPVEGGADIARVLFAAVKAAPKMTRFAAGALALVPTLAREEGRAEALAVEGGVDACVAVLRSNASSAPATAAAVNALLALASSDAGALSVAKLGGSRAVISVLQMHAGGDTAFAPVLERAMAVLARVGVTTEGAELLVKQGGVDAVIEAASAMGRRSDEVGEGGGGTGAGGASVAPSSAAVEKAEETLASLMRVFSRLVSKEDAIVALEGVHVLASSLEEGGSLPPPDSLRAALVKMPAMGSVPEFAEALMADGAEVALSRILAALIAPSGAGEARAMGLPLALKAFTALARNADLANAPALLTQSAAAIAAAPSSAVVADALDLIRAIASKSEASAALVAGGTSLNLVMETLQANLRSPEVASSAFKALAAMGSHATGAARLSAAPLVLSTVTSWLEDNADDETVHEDAFAAALSVVSALTAAPGAAMTLASGGTLDVIKSLLSKKCVEGSAPMPIFVRAATDVLGSLTTGDPSGSATSRIISSGLVRRMARVFSSSPAYVKHEGASQRLLEFFSASALSGGAPAIAELGDIGAMELVLSCMNANGTSARLVAAGAAALQVLGAGDEAARLALEDVIALNARITGGSTAEEVNDASAALGDAVLRLSNLTAIAGVVTSASSSGLLAALTTSLELLVASSDAPSAAVAATLQAIGRIAEGTGGSASIEATAGRSVAAMIKALEGLNKSRPTVGNASVRSAAVAALGQMVSSKAGAHALQTAGGVSLISSLVRSHLGDAKLAPIVNTAMRKITASATRDSRASLMGGASGKAALSALLAANAASSDTGAVAAVLTDVISGGGAEESVFEVLAEKSTSQDVLCEALQVMADHGEAGADSPSSPTDNASTMGRVAALTRALTTAHTLQNNITARSDHRSKLQALRATDNTLALLSRTTFDRAGAEAFLNDGGVKRLISILNANAEDEATVVKGLSTLRSVLSGGPSSISIVKHLSSAMPTLAAVVAANGGASSSVAADYIAIVRFVLCASSKEERAKWEPASLRMVAQLSKVHAAAPAVAQSVRTLETSVGTTIVDPEVASLSFVSALAAALVSSGSMGPIQEIVGEGGKAYFADSLAGTTVWEAPAEFARFKQSLLAAAAAATAQGEGATIATVERPTIEMLIAALKSQIRSPEILISVGRALGALVTNEENAALFVDAGGIAALIAAILANPSRDDLLLILLILMERLSLQDAHRMTLAEGGGVDVIVSVAIGHHVDKVEIALRSLIVLTNLAFHSLPIIGIIMAKEGVKGVEKCLQTHAERPRVLENAMNTLSNLMYGSEETKLIIGQTCGDEVTGIIRDHPSDLGLFKMALRALGNMSFCDKNIRFIVEEHHATKAIVAGMRAHPEDEEALEVAMEILGIFASLEEPPPEVDDEGNVLDSRDSISAMILREAGCAQIIATLKAFPQTPSVLIAGLEALTNIGNDVEVAERMCSRQGLLSLAFEITQTHSDNSEVVQRSMALLAVLTFSRDCLPLTVAAGGIPAVIATMELHPEAPLVLASAQLVLSNLAACEDARDFFQSHDGVTTLLGLLERGSHHSTFAAESCKMFTRLCAEDALSKEIASRGMHILMAVLERYEDDAEFLTHAFRTLGHLAFVESNVTMIVQHNGIQRIIKAIINHPDSRTLMVRSIQTLDNIAMANRENAAIVIDEGGKELIETIMESYPEDEEIKRFGKSALQSMSALENLTKSAELTARAARAGAAGRKGGETRSTDPLGEARHTLAAGKVMKVWTKGAPKSAHVVASPDFRSIVWQDVSTQRKLGALDLRAVVSVREGVGEGHKKSLLAGNKIVDASCAFSIVADRSSLDLEAGSPKEREKWVETFTKLLNVFRTAPQML